MKKLALMAAMTFLLSGISTADGSIVCTVSQSGANVVFSASGSINLTGLTRWNSGTGIRGILASRPWCSFGDSSDLYEVTSSPVPNHFGPGTGSSIVAPDSWDNNQSFGVVFNAAVSPKTFIIVPRNYTGSSLSNSMTFFNSTYGSLGLQKGDYQWTLSNGQYFQLRIGTLGGEAVPEPTTALIWSMLAGVGLVTYRRRR